MRKFKCLWSVLTEGGKRDTEIQKRIGIAKNAPPPKISRVIRNNERDTKLLRSPVWQWVLENPLKDEEETWNVVLQ